MRLLPKLTLGILAASAVPLAITGLHGARLSERTLRGRIEADHLALATNAAAGVDRFFDGVLASLSIYPQLVTLESATPEVATGVLRLAYRSGEDLAIVSLLEESGAEMIPSVFLSDPAAARELGDRPVVSAEDKEAFLARVPRDDALARGRAVGPVALVGGDPRCAVAVAFAGPSSRHVLAADVSLRRLGAELNRLSVGGTEVVVVDALRRVVAGGAPGRALLAAAAVPADPDPRGPLPAAASVARVRRAGSQPLLGAFAPAPGTALGVVVTQPEAIAFAVSRDLRQRTLYWLAIAGAVALVVGFGLARGLSHRVSTLADGTVRIARGDFDARLDAAGTDELAALASSFNHMAAELGRSAEEIRTQHEEIRRKNTEITAKNEEILVWNRDLERRVEEKSQELRRAQDLLLRSQSMAAIGTLGAGMAHEINNPLTGILGAAQLLLLDLPEGTPVRGLVQDVEAQAQRIRKIVANLLRMSQRESGEELAALDLGRVLEDALDLAGPEELARRQIVVEKRLAPTLPPVRGNRARLIEALGELLTNARRAMPSGGRLTLTTAAPDPRLVTVAIRDTGRGIEPEHLSKVFDPFFTTKQDWGATGMGLALVHRVVEDHRGSIVVESKVGEGSTFTMSFPTAKTSPHLGG